MPSLCPWTKALAQPVLGIQDSQRGGRSARAPSDSISREARQFQPLTSYPGSPRGPGGPLAALKKQETSLHPQTLDKGQGASRESGPHLPGSQRYSTVEERDRRSVRVQTQGMDAPTRTGKGPGTLTPTGGHTGRARTRVRHRPRHGSGGHTYHLFHVIFLKWKPKSELVSPLGPGFLPPPQRGQRSQSFPQWCQWSG